ncbi:YHS domain protein [Rhodobacteraceae bacterium KLH11]|nr:YHS domain protein [Rhodobacteraceae bacterium KLH11]
MLSRRSFITSLSSFALVPAVSAQEASLFYNGDGAAASGFDVVSYYGVSGPVPGRSDIALMWKGTLWRFASEDNRDRFERNPRAFAPQFGGYCAYAMRQGRLKSTDPRAWQIVDGRLYLIHSQQIEKIWKKNVSKNIRDAEDHWPAALYQ